MAKNPFNNRKFKYGSLATTLTIALIALIVIINIVCTTLTTNYSLKLDISGDGLYDLSTQTLQLIDKTESDVSFTVYCTEDEFLTQFTEVLRRIVKENDHFTLQFIDPDKNPTYPATVGSQYSIEEGALVMQCGSKTRVIPMDQMYEYDSDNGTLTYLIEERVAVALMGFMQDKEEVIYFVTGHGESNDETFRNLFANNGYTVEDIQLYKGMSFDANATLMIIVAPTKDYSVAEVGVVESFLTNNNEYGRNLMVFSGSADADTPNLEALLYEWGIEYNRDMVIESDTARYISLPTIFQPDIDSNDLTETLVSGNVPTIISSARSLDVRFEENGNLLVAPVLTTPSTSYSKDTSGGTSIATYDKQDGDTSGPLNIAVLSQMLKVYNNQNVYSHILAVGSSEMLISDYMAYANNGDFILKVYDLMMQRESETILDAVKYASSENLVLTEAQSTTINIIVMGVIPGIVLIIGIIVFIRRRYL